MDDALKSFVLNHHKLGQLNTQLREHRKAKQNAKARLLTAVKGQSTALKCKENTIVISVTHPKNSTVSQSDLSSIVDSLKPEEFRVAFEELMAEKDLVPLREVVRHAVILHLRSRKSTPKPTLKVKRNPKSKVDSMATVWVSEDSQEWLDAMAASTPKIHIETEMAALRKQQTDLSTRLQGGLQGAAAPDFQRPLYVNLDAQQHQFLLRNKPTVKKPSLNFNRLSKFLECARNEQLDRLVSQTTIDYTDVCALSRQLLPGVMTAIKEWQAKNATVSLTLTLNGVKK